MATLQRSLSLLRRIHGPYRAIPIKSNMINPHNIPLKPQYIAIRTYFNPEGDYQELSETAWKEKRLYRYYKFSNNLSVNKQQRGYAAGLFTIGIFAVMFFTLGFIDLETCVQYRNYRSWRKEELKPWLKAASDEGYWFGWNYSYDKLQDVYNKEIPQLRTEKGHDAKTKSQWKKKMCLTEVYKRDKEFDSPLLFGPFDFDMPPKAHPAYQQFEKQGEYFGIPEEN